jgi:hypothetical protein
MIEAATRAAGGFLSTAQDVRMLDCAGPSPVNVLTPPGQPWRATDNDTSQ